MRLTFFLEEIKNLPYIRDNFSRLQKQIDQEPLFKPNFSFLSITTTVAGTMLHFAHNLGYKPKDVLLLSASNSADVTFHYDSFTTTDIVYTVTVPTTIRCFVGLYAEELLR